MAMTITKYSGLVGNSLNQVLYTVPSGKIAKIYFNNDILYTSNRIVESSSKNASGFLKCGNIDVVSTSISAGNEMDTIILRSDGDILYSSTLKNISATSNYKMKNGILLLAGETVSVMTDSEATINYNFTVILEDI